MSDVQADVTVIIPAYNSAHCIGAALKSILNMSVFPTRIIVADDGSDDNTGEIVKKISADCDVKLDYIRPPHGGVSAARNAALEMVETDWVMFCDADDTVERDWLKALFSIKSESRIALCGYRENGRIVTENSGIYGADAFIKLYSSWLINSCCNKIYSTDILNINKIRFDTACSFGEDLDFNLKYLRHMSGFAVESSVTYNYFSSAKKESRFCRINRQRAVYRKIFDFMKDTGYDKKALKQMKNIRREAIKYEITRINEKPKKAVLRGYFAGNFGDDLIFKTLCERYRNVEFFAPVTAKDRLPEFNNLKPVRVDSPARHFGLLSSVNRIMKKADVQIYAGGSIFQQNKWWRENSINFEKSLKLPTFVLGASFGPVSGDDMVKTYRPLFEKCADVAFRDEYSARIFGDVKSVRQSFDTAEYCDVSGTVSDKSGIVISVISADNPSAECDLSGYYSGIAAWCDEIIAANRKVTLAAFCPGEGDAAACDEISKKCRGKVETVIYDGDTEKMLRVIAGAQCVIATRFHAALAAKLLNRPVIPVIYHSKQMEYFDKCRAVPACEAGCADIIGRIESACLIKTAGSESKFPLYEKLDKVLGKAKGDDGMTKKILLIIPSLKNGGAERIVSYLSTGLPRNWRVDLLVRDGNTAYPFRRDCRLVSTGGGISGIIKQLHFLHRAKKNNEYDIYNSHMASCNLLNLISGAKKAVLTIHSVTSFQMKSIRFGSVYNRIIRRFYGRAEKIVAVSRGVKNDLCEFYGIPENKIQQIENGNDISRVRRLKSEPLTAEENGLFSKRPVVTAMGRYTPAKGYLKLIQAFAEVAKKYHDARLIIIGEGELREEYSVLAKKLGLEENLILTGWLKNPFKIISNSDLFVLSSEYEGYGCALVEAMFCGVPCVTVNCPGIDGIMKANADNTEIVYSQYGAVCPPLVDAGAVKKLGEAMLKMLEDRQYSDKCVSENERREPELSIDGMIGKWTAMFEAL